MAVDVSCNTGTALKRPEHGCDYNAELISWCRKNLSFAQFETNQLTPPLPYDDASFDFVYSVSVFTHLPEPLQFAWISDLERVLKPGGLALITTHGEAALQKLTPSEQCDFRAGKLVVRYEEAPGTNLCVTFHPFEYVRGKLAQQFEVIDFAPGGAEGCIRQDIFLLRK